MAFFARKILKIRGSAFSGTPGIRRLECENVKVDFSIFHSNSSLVSNFNIILFIQFRRISVKFVPPANSQRIVKFDFIFEQPISGADPGFSNRGDH